VEALIERLGQVVQLAHVPMGFVGSLGLCFGLFFIAVTLSLMGTLKERITIALFLTSFLQVF